jgi:hypothetical protein
MQVMMHLEAIQYADPKKFTNFVRKPGAAM